MKIIERIRKIKASDFYQFCRISVLFINAVPTALLFHYAIENNMIHLIAITAFVITYTLDRLLEIAVNDLRRKQKE